MTVGGATAAQAGITYTYDQSPTYISQCLYAGCYQDPGLTKLTDGQTGVAGVAVNQASEWVGWYGVATVNIDFNLGAVRSVSSVSIGSSQNHLNDVVLPSFTVSAFEGGNWVVKGVLENAPSTDNNNSSYSTAPHPFFTLSDLGIQSQFVRISVLSNGPWAFLDEVSFQGNAVPEPGSAAMVLAGLGCLGLVSRRRRNR